MKLHAIAIEVLLRAEYGHARCGKNDRWIHSILEAPV
jgi:hypothetical protein